MITSAIAPSVGVGFKPVHCRALQESPGCVRWIEVHAENYMGAGGLPHAMLVALRADFPLSIHGVGLSLGGAGALDLDHLQRLAKLCDRHQPDLVSEHLAWSAHAGVFFNDLLPLPYTEQALARVIQHIDIVQSTLGRQLLLENPATYLRPEHSVLDEVDFLAEVVRHTGCGLLLDVNNAYVSATNHGHDAWAYLNRFPLCHVGEIHLAGHALDADETGNTLLIDAHGSAVAEPVWALYARVLAKSGPLPTLIEWDNDLPPWPVLHDEAQRAMGLLSRARPRAGAHAMLQA